VLGNAASMNSTALRSLSKVLTPARDDQPSCGSTFAQALKPSKDEAELLAVKGGHGEVFCRVGKDFSEDF
jgi:hypothetical protein